MLYLFNILSDCFYPLDHTMPGHPSLISGLENDKEIISMVGACPELLYCYAEITSLALHPADDAQVTSIRNRLNKFEQRSARGQSYSAADLENVSLDEKGLVITAADVTALIADSYVAAALVYLLCRVSGYIMHLSIILGI